MESFVKKLHKELESQLDEVKRESPLLRCYELSIKFISAKIGELKAHMLAQPFPGVAAEIIYFKHLVPPFYARFFYFTKVHALERQKAKFTKKKYRKAVKGELREIEQFHDDYGEFCGYYSSGATDWDEQLFTRNIPDSWGHDSLAAVIDPHYCLASYRVAWILAYAQFKEWLYKELRSIDLPEPTLASPADEYVWKESKSAAVELIKAMAESQSIYINNEPATSARLTKDFETKYGVDLSDFDQLLYATDTRKKEETPYLKKLISFFLGRRQRLRK